MRQLFHPQKGVLTKTGKKFSPTKGLVEIYSDEKGQKHELDGTEKPMEDFAKEQEQKKQAKEYSMQEMKMMEKEDEMEFEKNLSKQDEKESMHEGKMRMHEELLSSVENASESIVEAVKAIPETVIPEIKIPDHIEEQERWKDQILEALKIEIPEVDLAPVIKAIESIKFPEVKIPEAKDYTKLLEEIKGSLPKEVDFTQVVGAIMAIPRFEIPQELISNNRIKVEVDRIAMPTSGGGSASEETLQTLATEETLQAILASSGGTTYNYIQNDKTGSTYYYFGYASSTGWQFKRKELSTGIWMIASGSGDYTTNWTSRSSKTYSLT